MANCPFAPSRRPTRNLNVLQSAASSCGDHINETIGCVHSFADERTYNCRSSVHGVVPALISNSSGFMIKWTGIVQRFCSKIIAPTTAGILLISGRRILGILDSPCQSGILHRRRRFLLLPSINMEETVNLVYKEKVEKLFKVQLDVLVKYKRAYHDIVLTQSDPQRQWWAKVIPMTSEKNILTFVYL